MCTAKGSDVRPGVPWVSASFAWQAWHNVHCQGLGCTPWRPLGLRFFCVAGVAQCALPRGRMYALASLGSPPLLRGRRGTMCSAKGSDICPGVPWVSASFAWQAWHNVHCQGVGCTPWRPLGLRLFSVTHSHTLTHSLIHSLTHARTHPLPHSLTHFSGKGFCSIMICWLLLVPARVRVVVCLFISSFFFQETGLCSIMISWFLLVPVLAPVLVSLLSFVRKRVLFHGFSLSGSGFGAYVPSSPFFSFSQENGFVPPRLHGSVSTQASCVPFSISSLTNEFRHEQ